VEEPEGRGGGRPSRSQDLPLRHRRRRRDRVVLRVPVLYSSGVPIAETNRVVFTGGAPTVTALAGGHVDFAGQQWSESAGLIQGRKIRGLAVVHPTRLPGLADVPTAKEAGFPDLDVVGWQGLAGPPKLPAAVVQKWTALLEEAAKDPAFLEQAAKLNKVFAYKGPDAFWQSSRTS